MHWGHSEQPETLCEHDHDVSLKKLNTFFIYNLFYYIITNLPEIQIFSDFISKTTKINSVFCLLERIKLKVCTKFHSIGGNRAGSMNIKISQDNSFFALGASKVKRSLAVVSLIHEWISIISEQLAIFLNKK